MLSAKCDKGITRKVKSAGRVYALKKKWKNPFDEQSLICCAPHVSFPFSIVHANAEKDFEAWLCGKYINCSFKQVMPHNEFEISLYDHWSEQSKYLTSQTINLSKDAIEKLKFNIILATKKFIVSGAYPYGQCVKRYIVPTNNEQEDSLYDYIITGFDDDRNVLCMYGISAIGEYVYSEVLYDDYLKAICSTPSVNIEIVFWKYNSQSECSLNQEKVIKDLNDYITSQNSLPQPNEDRVFGMQACLELGRFICGGRANSEETDILNVKRLLLHKYLMLERIRYLCSGNIIEKDMLLSAEKVYCIAQTAFSLYCNKGHRNDVAPLIENMIKIEKTYLPKVLIDLKSKRF